MEDTARANIYAISSRSLEKAQKWVKDNNYPDTIAYGSYEEMLNDPKVEIVYICLPTAFKYEWGLKVKKFNLFHNFYKFL